MGIRGPDVDQTAIVIGIGFPTWTDRSISFREGLSLFTSDKNILKFVKPLTLKKQDALSHQKRNEIKITRLNNSNVSFHTSLKTQKRPDPEKKMNGSPQFGLDLGLPPEKDKGLPYRRQKR